MLPIPFTHEDNTSDTDTYTACWSEPPYRRPGIQVRRLFSSCLLASQSVFTVFRWFLRISKYKHINHTHKKDYFRFRRVSGRGGALEGRAAVRWWSGGGGGQPPALPWPDPRNPQDLRHRGLGRREREKLKLSPNPSCGSLGDWSRPLGDFKWLGASMNAIVELLVHEQLRRIVNRGGFGVCGKDIHRSVWSGTFSSQKSRIWHRISVLVI